VIRAVFRAKTVLGSESGGVSNPRALDVLDGDRPVAIADATSSRRDYSLTSR
jgi:hypothetical protein